jgi:voltage-gated potassium channel Kch
MWRQEDDGRIVHALEPLMLALALLALPVVVVEESPAPAALRSAAAAANWVIWRLRDAGGARGAGADLQAGLPLHRPLTAVLVVVAGASVSLVDSHDVPNLWAGIWWAVVTITTVGYGDVQIKTVAGQIVAMALMIVGIGFISVLTATVASSFIARGDEHQELVETLRSIERSLAALEER